MQVMGAWCGLDTPHACMDEEGSIPLIIISHHRDITLTII